MQKWVSITLHCFCIHIKLTKNITLNLPTVPRRHFMYTDMCAYVYYPEVDVHWAVLEPHSSNLSCVLFSFLHEYK